MEKMGPRDGGVVGEGADEPERSERAFVAGVVGMRRSEEARVSEEAVRRRDGGGGPRDWGVSQRWESRVTRANAGSLRRVERAKGEVRKPECQKTEDSLTRRS